MNETTYTPETRPRGFSWSGSSPGAYRDLLGALVAAQIKIRYGYTAIGIGWAVLNPLLQMSVYGFVFGSIFAQEQAHFLMYLLAGLLPWQAFSYALTACVSSIVNQSDLLRKAPFPSELLPLSAVANAFISLAVVMVLFVALLAVRGFPVWAGLPWVVAAMIVQALFLSGLALLVSCFNVFFRDTEQLLAFGVWLWFFMTPIVYPLGRLHAFERSVILHSNPMAGVVTTMQRALLEGRAPLPGPFLAAALISLATFAAGWLVFRHYQYELPKVA